MSEVLRQDSGLTASFQETLEAPDQLTTCQQDFLCLQGKPGGRYLVGYAISPSAQREAFRLRYEVFNLELKEGLESSHQEPSCKLGQIALVSQAPCLACPDSQFLS